jgi:hypothetical protein
MQLLEWADECNGTTLNAENETLLGSDSLRPWSESGFERLTRAARSLEKLRKVLVTWKLEQRGGCLVTIALDFQI